jgi:hypothetical protein
MSLKRKSGPLSEAPDLQKLVILERSEAQEAFNIASFPSCSHSASSSSPGFHCISSS